ncbi:KPN_02809 family neutral zinc metallopeptidase [Tenggerimyces flavus]|uniref:Neutral zinc metallopeptidase n=1 Tax=Tenggerimyces flavus TaxID=1708749 RepID=A0ABV7YFB8_9ACTN|nr:neutral zinc metallopeptidase [Tenggerimyces flavus]MBM7786706.1 putative metalloprotease [Tenggerimyces flavus]
MKFNPRARLDSSQVEDTRGRRMPGGRLALPVGGGVGGLIVLLVLVFLNGGQLPAGLTGEPEPAPDISNDTNLEAVCKTGEDIQTNRDCRFVAEINSIQAFWTDEFTQRNATYDKALTHFFTDQVSTDCGAASSAVGPFYCPVDDKVYVDLGFFDTLESQLGAQGGDFAEAYVIAHEYGHHVQDLLGTMEQVRSRQGEESDAVRLELQADCYAGMWAKHATQVTVPGTDEPFIIDLTAQDIALALDAAEAVGDDRIQSKAQGQVTPETWTHGSAQMRNRWFSTGYESGELEACDTFAARQL